MVEEIPEHAHCQMCGKSIAFGETLCSDECKQKFKAIMKRRRLILYLMYGMLAVLIIIFVIGGNLVK